MRLALAKYRGGGTSSDPFTPDCEHAPGWGAFDLRGNCADQSGYVVVLADDDSSMSGAVRDLGDVDELDEPVSWTTRNFIENRLGVSFPSARTTRTMLRELMLDLGDHPGKWRRLQVGDDSFVRASINGVELFTIPVVRGGAIFTESFFKSDSTILGPDLTWTEVVGDGEVFNAKWRNVTGNGDVLCRAEHDVGSANMYAQAFMDYSSFGNWMIFARWVSSATTCYCLGGNNVAAQGVRLFKVITGGFTELTGSPASFTTTENTQFLYRIEINSSSQVIAKVNGTTILTISDTSIATGQRGGLGSFAPPTQMRWDTFEMGPLGVAIPGNAILDEVAGSLTDELGAVINEDASAQGVIIQDELGVNLLDDLNVVISDETSGINATAFPSSPSTTTITSNNATAKVAPSGGNARVGP